MPISGLVITLDPDDASAQAAAAIDQHDRFESGQRIGPRLSAVLDTPDRTTDRQCWDWLNALPGVRHVDVVFIHFDTPPPEGFPPRDQTRKGAPPPPRKPSEISPRATPPLPGAEVPPRASQSLRETHPGPTPVPPTPTVSR